MAARASDADMTDAVGDRGRMGDELEGYASDGDASDGEDVAPLADDGASAAMLAKVMTEAKDIAAQEPTPRLLVDKAVAHIKNLAAAKLDAHMHAVMRRMERRERDRVRKVAERAAAKKKKMAEAAEVEALKAKFAGASFAGGGAGGLC